MQIDSLFYAASNFPPMSVCGEQGLLTDRVHSQCVRERERVKQEWGAKCINALPGTLE